MQIFLIPLEITRPLSLIYSGASSSFSTGLANIFGRPLVSLFYVKLTSDKVMAEVFWEKVLFHPDNWQLTTICKQAVILVI